MPDATTILRTMLASTLKALFRVGTVERFTKQRLSTLKACIVGAGPAGYYTAQRLLKGNDGLRVDIVDKLPVPFGLVRFGVAPDHPEVKNVISTFTQTARKYKDRCHFIGNIEVGRDIQLADLQKLYDIVVLSYGAENDRKLGISGEDARGVYSAREFVGWYNGEPEFSQFVPKLADSKCAVIMGQGNVAMDIARLLLMPVDELAKTDICQHALEVIAASKLESVHIVGRRGPLQAAFTIKEFRELTKLPQVEGHVPPEHVKNINISELPRPRRRLTELIKKMSSQSSQSSECRKWYLDFLLTPRRVLTVDGNVSALQCVRNTLVGEDIESQRAVQTDEGVDIPCDIIIRSIGYQSTPIAESSVLPFDTKAFTIPNDRGRVTGQQGMYCSGWVKRGPVGVIVNTMTDAFETADTILEDLESGKLALKSEGGCSSDLHSRLDKETVDFDGWEKIDQVEMERGEQRGKPREKITDIHEMIRVAKS